MNKQAYHSRSICVETQATFDCVCVHVLTKCQFGWLTHHIINIAECISAIIHLHFDAQTQRPSIEVSEVQFIGKVLNSRFCMIR